MTEVFDDQILCCGAHSGERDGLTAARTPRAGLPNPELGEGVGRLQLALPERLG